MDETETTLDSLPLDILREIFLRLPVESLGILAGLCTLFERFITKDPSLVAYFRDNATTLADVVVLEKEMTLKSQHISHETIISKFENLRFSNPFYLDETLVIAGSCNGLVCFYQYSPESFVKYNKHTVWEHPLLNQSAEGTVYHYRIYIWNPMLHQIRALPKLIGPSDFVAFGYDKENEDYKVLWISRGKRNKAEVYSWKNKSWKMISKNFRYVPDDYPTKRSGVVEFDGSLYWISGVTKSGSRVISVFDITRERFDDVIYVPRDVSESKMLGVFEGCLSLLGDRTIWSWVKSRTPCSWERNGIFYEKHRPYFNHPYYGHYCGLTANGKILIAGSGEDNKRLEALKLEFVSKNYSRKSRLLIINYVKSLNSVYPPRGL